MEDVKEAFEAARKKHWIGGRNFGNDENMELDFESVDDYLQSLSQPKVFNVEVEMEYKDGYGNWLKYDKKFCGNQNLTKEEHQKDYPKFGIRPKITNNSIKIIKVL